MRKLISYILSMVLAVNISLIAFAQELVAYNDADTGVLKSILNELQNNINSLNWDLENPGGIEGTEWIKTGDEYYLTSLDLSDLSIDGDINLTNCLHLEECVFSDTNINSIQLPESLANISSNASKNCSQLQVITINADDTVIGSGAFSGCVLLKSIVNAEKIISIGRNAFNNCENLDFYLSESNSNSYIENYARQYNFDFVNSVISNTYGYVGIMNGYNNTKFDLTELSLPYNCGTVSIYTMDKQFIKTIKIDENGKFNFENLTIGTKYRIVIDGDTAVPREEFFVPITQNYCIAQNTECFGMIVCDYNRDGIVNRIDIQEFLKAYNHNSNDELFDFSIYDFNCDQYCDTTDLSLLLDLLSVDYHNFEYN